MVKSRIRDFNNRPLADLIARLNTCDCDKKGAFPRLRGTNYSNFHLNQTSILSATLKERKIEISNFEKYYCLDLEYKNNGQQETIVYLRFLDGVHLVVLTTPANAPHENYIAQLKEAIGNMNFVEKAQNPTLED